MKFHPTLAPEIRSHLMSIGTPRTACGGPWTPAPHPKQAAYLCLHGREGLFGGAAGGGKSAALLMASLQYVCVPGYSALLLRQSYPQLEGEDGLIERSKSWLAERLGAGDVHYSERRHRFRFPSGASLTLGFLDKDADRLRYQGLAFQFVGFDELTHWRDAKGYLYVGFSRVRRPAPSCAHCATPMVRTSPTSPWRHSQPTECTTPEANPLTVPPACPGCGYTVADVPLRTRAGTNPGGPGHTWVHSRFITRSSTRNRFFVPSTIEDNPTLDPVTYIASLAELPIVERMQLLRGDWNVREDGRVFARRWFLGDAA